MNVQKKKFLNIIRRSEEKDCSVKKQLKAKKKRIRRAKKKLLEISNEEKTKLVK